MKEIQSEIKQARRYHLTIHLQMFLRQMPATRPHQQRRRLFVELISLSALAKEIVRRTASNKFTWPSTRFRHVGAVASSKSAMNTFAPEFKRIDDHLAIHRAR